MRYQYELLGWSTISAAQRYFAQACALEPRAGLAFEQRAQLESYMRVRITMCCTRVVTDCTGQERTSKTTR